MKLTDYVIELKECKLLAFPEQVIETEFEVKGIAYNSKEVEKESIFFVKGKTFINEYLLEAVKNGAKVIVSENTLTEELPTGLLNIIVTDVTSAMSIAADMFYNSPWANINTIGITGTKGKSTTAFLVKSILEEGQVIGNVGITSSIKNYYGETEKNATLTTPEVIDVYKYLNSSVNNGLEHFIMEVSSQGLKYGRLIGINYDIGCFLNFGNDHISEEEHPSLEDYYESKKKLITKSKCAIINLDIEQSQDIINTAIDSHFNEEIVTFGTCERADVYGYDLVEETQGISFKAKTKDFDEEFYLSIQGGFNLENALCAIAIGVKCGINLNKIKSALEKTKVEGRMEFKSINDKEVLLDHAHNDLSYMALKEFIERNYKGRSIYTVFGCAGERGNNRRKAAGEIVGSFSEKVYIVSHKAGNEDPLLICKQIAEGITVTNCEYEIILDRMVAVKKALDNLPRGGLLIVTCMTSDQLVELKLLDGEKYVK